VYRLEQMEGRWWRWPIRLIAVGLIVGMMKELYVAMF